MKISIFHHRIVRSVLAVLVPFLAFAIQLKLWNMIQPFIWFLFYPAVFISSWIGNFYSGLAATIISIVLVVVFFVQPGQTPILPVGVFFIMGLMFSMFHERLRLASQETADALATLESFYKYTHTCIVFLDTKFNFLRVNEAYARVCGRDVSDFAGHNHFVDYPSEELKGKFQRVVDTKESYSVYGRPFVFPDHPEWGEIYWDLSVAPILDETGKVKLLILSLLNITERKKAEEELKRHRENLEGLVKERTIALEGLNKEMEAFIYSVSHDLRAPLRITAGFIEALKKNYAEKLDDQGRDYLERVIKSSSKMNRLVEELLNLSRISRQDVKREKFDMSALASSIFSDFQETDRGRKVDIFIQRGLSPQADPDLMKIALTNLLGNAWKFTSKTEKARIEFGTFECEGETVYYVKDNGAGFDSQNKEKIFLPFHRLHTDQEFEGTGIGLSIVDRIIFKHGGRVWIEGEVGKGAVVYFTLNEES